MNNISLSSCCKAPVTFTRKEPFGQGFLSADMPKCTSCGKPYSIEQHNPFDLSTPIAPGYEVKNANTASYPPASTGHGVEGKPIFAGNMFSGKNSEGYNALYTAFLESAKDDGVDFYEWLEDMPKTSLTVIIVDKLLEMGYIISKS